MICGDYNTNAGNPPYSCTNSNSVGIIQPLDIFDGDPEAESSPWWNFHYGGGNAHPDCSVQGPCNQTGEHGICVESNLQTPCSPVPEWNDYIQSINSQVLTDLQYLYPSYYSTVEYRIHSMTPGVIINQLSSATVTSDNNIVAPDMYPDSTGCSGTAQSCWFTQLAQMFTVWPTATFNVGEWGWNRYPSFTSNFNNTYMSSPPTVTDHDNPAWMADKWKDQPVHAVTSSGVISSGTVMTNTGNKLTLYASWTNVNPPALNTQFFIQSTDTEQQNDISTVVSNVFNAWATASTTSPWCPEGMGNGCTSVPLHGLNYWVNGWPQANGDTPSGGLSELFHCTYNGSTCGSYAPRAGATNLYQYFESQGH